MHSARITGGTGQGDRPIAVVECGPHAIHGVEVSALSGLTSAHRCRPPLLFFLSSTTVTTDYSKMRMYRNTVVSF